MGELLLLLCVIGVAWFMLKVVGAIFHLTFAALALPFQILFAVGAVLLGAVLIIPTAIFAGVLGILLAPFLLIVPMLPFIIIGAGIILLLRSKQPAQPSQPPRVNRDHMVTPQNLPQKP